MKIEYKKYVKEDAKYLECYIGGGFEGMIFNGNEEQYDDENGSLTKQLLPLMYIPKGSDNDFISTKYCGGLHFIIDLDEGEILNPDFTHINNIKFDTCNKSCDNNFFKLLDKDLNIIHQTTSGDTEYMIGPSFMNSYGDYLEMKVEGGKIYDYTQYEMCDSIQTWLEDDE